MTRFAFPVIGLPPRVNLYRSIRHEKPCNENAPHILRQEWVVAACEFLRRRSVKLKAKALRLVTR